MELLVKGKLWYKLGVAWSCLVSASMGRGRSALGSGTPFVSERFPLKKVNSSSRHPKSSFNFVEGLCKTCLIFFLFFLSFGSFGRQLWFFWRGEKCFPVGRTEEAGWKNVITIRICCEADKRGSAVWKWIFWMQVESLLKWCCAVIKERYNRNFHICACRAFSTQMATSGISCLQAEFGDQTCSLHFCTAPPLVCYLRTLTARSAASPVAAHQDVLPTSCVFPYCCCRALGMKVGKEHQCGFCCSQTTAVLLRMECALAKTGLEKKPLVIILSRSRLSRWEFFTPICKAFASWNSSKQSVSVFLKNTLIGNSPSEMGLVSAKSCFPAPANGWRSAQLLRRSIPRQPMGQAELGDPPAGMGGAQWAQWKVWWPQAVMRSSINNYRGILMSWNYLVGESKWKPHQRRGNHPNFSFNWLMKL